MAAMMMPWQNVSIAHLGLMRLLELIQLKAFVHAQYFREGVSWPSKPSTLNVLSIPSLMLGCVNNSMVTPA